MSNSAFASEKVETEYGIWEVKAFVDEFNLPTDDYYVVGDETEGTFSNSVTTNSDLTVRIEYAIIQNYDMLTIYLYEYGNYRVTNSSTSNKTYTVSIMDSDGNKYETQGAIVTGADCIALLNKPGLAYDPEPILKALKKGGTVRFSIKEKDNLLTRYIYN